MTALTATISTPPSSRLKPPWSENFSAAAAGSAARTGTERGRRATLLSDGVGQEQRGHRTPVTQCVSSTATTMKGHQRNPYSSSTA